MFDYSMLSQHIMQLKTISRSIAKFSALSILTGTLLFSGAQIAHADLTSNNRTFPVPTQPKSVAIDSYTDHFFYAANPELNKRRLDADETIYIQEWQAIRQALMPLVKFNREACGRHTVSSEAPYWEFDLSVSRKVSSYDYLTDAIFYHRNPDMIGQKLRPRTAAAKEWLAIRRNMYISTCGI